MGIEHALLPEQGVVGAGDVIIGADSHTCTYGALGAFATGVGSTDVAAAMATGEAWFKVPASAQVRLQRQARRRGSAARTSSCTSSAMIGVDGALYQAMEFTGDAIDALAMDGRLTMCNMAIEAGGKNGIIAVDDVTRAYLAGRTERKWTEYVSGPGRRVRATSTRSTSRRIEPHGRLPAPAGNTRRRPRTRATSRSTRSSSARAPTAGIEDLRVAARVLRGPQGAPERADDRHPGDAEDLPRGDARGAARHLRRGRRRGLHADLRPVPRRAHGHPGGRASVRSPPPTATSSGRMGHPKSEVYLAGARPSPPPRAVLGRIAQPRTSRALARQCSDHTRRTFEMKFTGTAHRFGDDIDTDVIIPARYLNTSDPDELAAHCMEDLDAEFVGKVRAGRHHRGRGELRLRLLARARADRHQGCGRLGRHRADLRAHLLPQRHQHRAADHGVARRRSTASARATGEVDADAGMITNETTGTTFTAQPFPPFIKEHHRDRWPR